MNGKTIKEKRKEFLIMRMVIDMKVIIEMVKEKEKVFFILQMVIDMKVT